MPTDGKGRVVGLHGRVSHEIDSVTVRSGEPEPTYRIHQGNENQLKVIECGVEGRVPVPSPRQSFHEGDGNIGSDPLQSVDATGDDQGWVGGPGTSGAELEDGKCFFTMSDFCQTPDRPDSVPGGLKLIQGLE